VSLHVAVLVLTACTMANVSVERDALVAGVWAKRGQTLGDLAHLYCEQGAQREREAMAWAIRRSSYPAVVTIHCSEDTHAP
jgi:hypothetical protein